MLRRYFTTIGLLLAGAVALAVGTPAGTEITNQATATYIDTSGVEQTASSGVITVTVSPVYDFMITPDGSEADPGQTATAAPGEDVTFVYTVTNQGNSPDTIDLTLEQSGSDNFNLTDIRFYWDVDEDGVLSEGDLPITSVEGIKADESRQILVIGTVPSGATGADLANSNLVGTSAGDSDTDDDNWAQAGVETGPEPVAAVNIGNNDGTDTPDDTEITDTADPGETVTFPLILQNGGTAPDTFDLSVVSDFPAAAVTLYADENCDGTIDTGTDTVIDVTDELEPGGVTCLIVQILMPGDAPAGDYDVTVTATSQNDPAVSDSITNTVTVEGSEPTPGVDIGNGDEDAGSPPSNTAITLTAEPGVAVSYPIELTNTGSGPDSFTLTIPNLPAGWTAQIFPDEDCDGDPDGAAVTNTGTLEAGDNVCFIVTVTPAAGAQPDLTPITVTATSDTDPAVSDSITNTLEIEGDEPTSGVNIGNGDENPTSPPSDAGQILTATPGAPLSYPLELTNTGDEPDTFDLTIPGLPSGWTAQIFPDDDCDGEADSGTPISSTGELAPGDNICLVVTVTPPAGAAPGSTPVTVTATSQNDPAVADSITNTLVIDQGGGGNEAGVNIGNGDENPATGPNDAGLSVTAQPGVAVSYPLELTNTGDTDDTFTLNVPNVPSGWTVQIFPDANCNGEADGTSPITSVGPLEPGENVCLVVTVTPPAGASTGSTPITITATSQNDPSVSDSITNTVVVERGGGGEEAGVNIGNGDGNPATGPSDSGKTFTVEPGQPFTYPLELTNTGDETDTFDLTIPKLPDGWTAQIFPDANCDGAADSSTPITAVGPLESAENVCFVVTVTPPAGAQPGSTPITVTATSQNDPSVSDSITNTLVIEQDGGGGNNEAGVNIGNGDGNSGTAPSDSGKTLTAQPGTPRSYPLELTNTGDETDTFDLTIPNLPSGWTAQLFPDSNCDGVADSTSPISAVGPLEPGENVCFVATVTPPAGAQPGATPITVTATSRNDPSVSDSITNTIVIERGGGGGNNEVGVNIGNGDRNSETGPSDSSRTFTVKPGQPFTYPLELTNTGDEIDTFDLTIPGLPEGWSAQIFADADCNGVADGDSPVTSVGPLDPGENVCLVVVVTPPADAQPGTTPVTVTATSRNDPSVSDSITNTLVIERGGGGGENDVGVDIGNGDRNPDSPPSDSGKTISATPGQPVSYPLELTNTGDSPDSYTLTIPGLPDGWTAQIFPDEDCDGTADSDTPITSVGPLDPGENICLVVTVTPPADAEPGSTPITVTATSDTDPTVSDSITNTLVIERGGGGGEREPEIMLTKSVTPGGSVQVGDTLTYTVAAQNTGDAAASNTRIYDPLPGGTAFVSASATTALTGEVLYSVGGSSWSETAPTSLESGSSLYVGVDTNGDATIGGADTFAEGGSLSLTLTVRVTGGESVTNQAQASYSGRTATSNTVTSTVGDGGEPKPPRPATCDLSVTPDGSVAAPAYAETAGIGSVVTLPYILTNLGDAGSDVELSSPVLDESTADAEDVRVLLDSNGNGVADAGEAAVTSLTDLPEGGTVALLLEVTAGDTTGELYVNLRARCAGDSDNDTLDADNVSQITVAAGTLTSPTKTAEPAAGTALYPGAPVSYTISFAAEGGPLEGVVMTDVIDDDLELPTSYSSGTITDPATGLTTEAAASLSGRTLTWTFAEVPAGMTVALNVATVVGANASPPATIDNVACVAAAESDALCSAPVSHTLAPVELELSKTAMSSTVAIGDRLTFELVVTNASEVVPVQGGRLTDPLPEGLEYIPGSAVRVTDTGTEEALEPAQEGNTLIWTLPALAPGASLTVRFDTRVTTAAIGQDEIMNRAEATGIGSDGGVVADDVDDAAVTVDDALFRARSVLLGHAYTDEDDSGDFSDGDKPVANVRLYLSNGVSVVTDAFGRYTVTDLPSGLLALRLDKTTTGGREPLTTPTATHEGLWRVRLLPGLITRQDVPFEARAEAAASPTGTDSAPVPEAQRDPSLPPSPVETLTGLQLLEPANGDVVRGRSSVPIIIEAPLGDTVTLAVNGQTIPASLLGTQVLDQARQRQRLEYVGVRLGEGVNDLLVTSTPAGGMPTTVKGQVAVAGRPTAVVIEPDGPLTADSAAPLAFTLRLEDDNGYAPADTFVTLEADGATFASKDANRRAPGMQVKTVDGRARFTLEPLPQPAPITLRANVQTLEAEQDFAVTTASRPWVGAAAGSAGASYAPGQPLEFGISGTLFARGSLFGGLLTVGGRYPEEVYGEPTDPFTTLPEGEVVEPDLVTGSSGPTRREARSEDGVYFRFEDNLSFVQYGDFTTDLLGPLLGGGRELTGLSGRYARFGGGFDVRGYASFHPQGEEVTGREVPSNGTSLYLLPKGIEALRVSAVSKDDAGVVVSQDDLAAGTDYRFTAATGELLLSTPLPLQDELGNRNFLRLSYSFPAGVDAPRVLEAGAQVAYDFGVVAPRFGVAQSQNGSSTVRALSAGVAFDDDNGLSGSADVAFGGDEAASGLAAHAEATYDGETLDGSASYSYTSPAYASPDLAATEDVGQDIRFGISYDVSEALNLAANTHASQTPTTGYSWLLQADALASYDLAQNTEVQGGLEYDDGSVRGLAGMTLREPFGVKRADVSVLHHQGITPASTSETDFGVSYALLENLALTLTEHLEWGSESNLLVGLESGFDNSDIFGGDGYAGRTTLSTQYELPGGVSAAEGRARLGLSTVYPLSDALSVNGSLEQILDLTGEESDRTVGTVGATFDTDDLDAEGRAELGFGDDGFKGVFSAGSTFRLSDHLYGGVNALYSQESAADTPQGFSFNIAGAYRSLAFDLLTSHTVRLGSLAPETGDELTGEVRAAVPFGVHFDLRGSYLYRSQADSGLIDMTALGAGFYPWNGGSVSLYGQLFHLWLDNDFVLGGSLELSQEVICGLYAVGGYNFGGITDPLGPGYGGEGLFLRLDVMLDEQLLCGGEQ